MHVYSRLLPAFNTSNGIPYAWVNLQKGVLEGETRDTCTAGVGTLMLEMGLLSYITQNDIYFTVSHKALMKLWRLRSVNNNLLGIVCSIALVYHSKAATTVFNLCHLRSEKTVFVKHGLNMSSLHCTRQFIQWAHSQMVELE